MLAAIALGVLLTLQGGTVLDDLKSESNALRGFVETKLGISFLSAVADLPDPGTRTIFQDPATGRYYASDKDLPPSAMGPAKAIERDARFYYYTKYGSPLAYARAVDLLGKAGMESFHNRKLCDFGYGGIGPLRLIANLGAQAVGVDVDSLLKALYGRPEDTGKILTRGVQGGIRLIEGFFPSDPETVLAVGDGYDVFLSKNTLKRGYVHPEKEVDKRMLVDLGVSDLQFCQQVAATLKRGGLFLMYNLSPAQNPVDKPYLPWADGRCPFARETLERAGFEVLGYDVVDDKAARDMGRRLGWDKGQSAMDFEKDLFSHYTLARKR